MSRDWSCRAGFSVWLNAKPRFRRIRWTARTFLMAFWNLKKGVMSFFEKSNFRIHVLRLPWPIIGDVVLLYLLRNVIWCRHICSSITVGEVDRKWFEMDELGSGLTISTRNLGLNRSQGQGEWWTRTHYLWITGDLTPGIPKRHRHRLWAFRLLYSECRSLPATVYFVQILRREEHEQWQQQHDNNVRTLTLERPFQGLSTAQRDRA